MNILIEFENRPILFQSPASIISCFTEHELEGCFAAAEKWLKKGFYLAGFFSYETGYAFEPRLSDRRKRDFPLLCFGCYEKPAATLRWRCEPDDSSAIGEVRISTPRKHYDRDIAAIRDYILQGEVYQITYCIKLHFPFRGSAFHLYKSLLNEQPVPYPAYLETDRFKICSLSPELFLKKKGDSLVTKPMKGTWPRGDHFFSDILAGLKLYLDKKNRAENLMITDLLRNDIGRIGEKIFVPRLFEVARYKTLYQMTSTVTGKVNTDITIRDLFAAVFPSGSVTGAPKIRAMQIIRELEEEERRIYTGAIGYITPNKDMFFNVPIRTLLLRNGSGEMGIGGGIVWDSTPEGEWNEGTLKARFLTDMAVKNCF